MAVSALFRTSIKCAPEETIAEGEIEAEPLSPSSAAAAAAFESAPFARLELEPATLMLELGAGIPSLVAVVTVTNTGGVQGTYHVCGDSRPAWLNLEGSGRGTLARGRSADLRIIVDGAAARAAASGEGAKALGQSDSSGDPRVACAVLRLEANGGGAGVLLPVVCNVTD